MSKARRITSFILCLILALGNLHSVHADEMGPSSQESTQTEISSSATSDESTDATEPALQSAEPIEANADDAESINTESTESDSNENADVFLFSGEDAGAVDFVEEITGTIDVNSNEITEVFDDGTEEADAEQKEASDEEATEEDATDSEKEESESEEDEKEELDSPAFDQTQKLDGVEIRVTAEEDTFPEDATLFAERVTDKTEQRLVDEALEEERPDNVNIAGTYTFDIKVLDADGNEIQPVEGKNVKVSFVHEKVESEQLETNIYHIKEEGDALTAESLAVETEGDMAVVETDGFSYYTVEFTYNDLQYVLEGGGMIKLDDLLASIGIEGKVKGVSVSAPDLFDVILGSEDGVNKITGFNADENGGVATRPINDPEGTVRWVVSYAPFSTEEWMDVVMQNNEEDTEETITYRIVVTDAQMADGAVDESVTGMHQGEGSSFASEIPVADIWIDGARVNATRESRDSAIFVPGEMMDPTSTKYHPGFQEDITGVGGGLGRAGYEGDHFIVFDSTRETLDGEEWTTKKSDGSLVVQSYNYFPGVIGAYKWENAAVRMDEHGGEEYLDVYIEYANPMITIETEPTATSAASWNDAYVGLFGGNIITLTAVDASGNRKDRYGLQMDVRPYVADKDGNPVSGKFFFPMVDLDVRRDENVNFKRLYGANEDFDNYDATLNRYSEQVRIGSGIVQNSSGDKIYIPGSEGGYKSLVQHLEKSDEYIVTARSVGDDSTFYSGFLTLAENGNFELKYNAASSNTGGIETYVLAGTEFNYRLRHTTETLPSAANPNPNPNTGGTIQTTREGNHSGRLDDGEIIDPAIIATAIGQSIVYTFYPKAGYGIRELWIWNDDVTTYGSTPAAQQKNYDWADGTDRYVWYETDSRWHLQAHYNITSDPEGYIWTDGTYTYEWNGTDWNKILTFANATYEQREDFTWVHEEGGVAYRYLWDTTDEKWYKYDEQNIRIGEEEPPVDAVCVVESVVAPPNSATADLGATSEPPANATNVFPSTDALKRGTGTRIREGNGTNSYQAHDDDGDGIIDRYTFSFDRIHADNAIHVVWGQTILDIRKTTTGSGAVDDTFTFHIKAWKDSDYVDFTSAEDPAMAARFTAVAGETGLYEFQLENGEVLNIPPEMIPVEYEWQVEEVKSRPDDDEYGLNADGWEPVGSTVKSGVFVRYNESQQANFTNKRKQEVQTPLTVKKVWVGDDEGMRPKSLAITITQTGPVGISPATFRSTMEELVSAKNISAIKAGTKEEYEANAGAAKKIPAIKGSGEVAMWKNGTEIYFYSDSEIYLIGSMEKMFYSLENLSDISGLAKFHTDFATSFAQLFSNDRKITDISALANWNTANVTDMSKVFAPDNIKADLSTQMNISDISPLAGWQTQNVTTMRWMFRGAGMGLKDVTPIANWDVSRVEHFQDMFFRTDVGGTASALSSWDVGMADHTQVKGFSQMFFRSTNNQNSAPTGSAAPNWSAAPSNRPGTWNNGTYTTSTAQRASTTPTNKNDEEGFWQNAGSGSTITETAHDVDDNDPNVWIYEFDVPDNSSAWTVYETIPSASNYYYTVSASYEDPNGNVTDLGDGVGRIDNPVTIAVARSTTTLTNVRKEYELKVKKDATEEDLAESDEEVFATYRTELVAAQAHDKNNQRITENTPEEDLTDAQKTELHTRREEAKRFTFNIQLWTASTSDTYDFPADHPKMLDGSLTRLESGLYQFTLIAPGTEEFELPAGVHYKVTEEPKTGWVLSASHRTVGTLDEDGKEASFLNTRTGKVKVAKIWEGDQQGSTIFKTRPTGYASLGIVVTTKNTTDRWKVNGEIHDVNGQSIDGLPLLEVRSAYEESGFVPEVMNSDGVTPYTPALTAPRLVKCRQSALPAEEGTSHIAGLDAGYYVIDRITSGHYLVFAVEMVPFEKTYDTPVSFLEDDNAGDWLYEFNIPEDEEVLKVEETRLPEYYQKVEKTTDASGETVYQITNTLETRNLEVKKETVDDEYGEFNFGIKFWIENDTSERHPVKVGHSQFLVTEDGEGNPVYEYEFFFEDGVTINGKNVAGLHEKIGDVIYSYPKSGKEQDKITELEGEPILTALLGISVNGTDPEFTRHHSTNLTLADLGIMWHGQNSEDIYVEQDAETVENMFTNGRRLDWFIIPTPGHDEEITIRTPYILREADEVDPETGEVIAPKQKPIDVTGDDGTYYFSLKNGGTIRFDSLPVGVSYDIVEMKKLGWDLIDEENENGVMIEGAEEIWLYKGTEYSSLNAAEAAAISEITDNGDGTYTYEGETYTSYIEAETAAKAQVTKKPYPARVATFTNEREKGTIKIKKETVQEDGTFTFRMQTGRVVDAADVKDQNGDPLTITRIYPTGQSARTVAVSSMTHYTNYTEYVTAEGTYQLNHDGTVTKDGNAIRVFNLVYPQQFTTDDGMNYTFTTVTDDDAGTTTTTLNVETTTFEFNLRKDEFATVDNIPYGSRDKIWEMSTDGWELISIDGDESKTVIDKTMSTNGTVTHTFLNDRATVPLTVEKQVTGNQGSRDKYFKFKLEIANAGQRTIHMDTTNADRSLDGTTSETPNAATIYTRDTIVNGSGTEGGNGRDDDADLTYGEATETQKLACEWTDGTYNYKYDDDGWTKTEIATGIVDPDGGEPPATATRTFGHGQHIHTDAEGKATVYFYLQHGQSVTFRDIPFGASYTVTEVNEDYRPSTAITGPTGLGDVVLADTKTGETRDPNTGEISEGTDISLGDRKTKVEDSFLQKETVITFANTRDGVVPTEIFFSWQSWLILLALAGAYIGIRIKRRRYSA